MKLETDTVLAVRAPPPAAAASGWPQTLWAIAAALAAIALLYRETALSMLATWTGSTAYNHGYFIAPIALWLAWRKRAELAMVEPKIDVLGYAALAAAGFAWLVADAGRVLVVQQYSLAAMPAAVVLALAGRRAAAVLAFPLAFLLFAVPTGDALVPRLMDWTADFTVTALRASGVPVYREGNSFSIPTGNWSVVEACSGLRYVIASVTVGALFAYLNYRTFWKRALFVAFSALVPVAANFLRAYLIVMAGHLSNMKLGVGVDHMLFGWLFFGAVIALLFWLASFWRDAEPAANALGAPPGQARALRHVVAAAAAGTIVLAAAWPLYGARLEQRSPGHAPAQIAAAAGEAGWVLHPVALTDWRPHYAGAAASRFAVYRKGEQEVALYIAYYRDQRQGAELVSWENAVLHAEDRRWVKLGEAARDVRLGAEVLRVRETRIRSAGQRLLVWDWYRIGAADSSNPYVAKALLARDKLLGRGDASAAIVLAAPYDSSLQAAGESLAEFARDMLPAIGRALAGTEGDT